ncbi:MAG: class I SAM-dependent methyltransferase [Firmicutes bacterium]|nr:class I SAM-dependent methyltransferase [Bacillota bacterium]
MLRRNAAENGVADRITAVASSMETLDAAEESFDLIWSEKASS